MRGEEAVSFTLMLERLSAVPQSALVESRMGEAQFGHTNDKVGGKFTELSDAEGQARQNPTSSIPWDLLLELLLLNIETSPLLTWVLGQSRPAASLRQAQCGRALQGRSWGSRWAGCT